MIRPRQDNIDGGREAYRGWHIHTNGGKKYIKGRKVLYIGINYISSPFTVNPLFIFG